MNLNDRRSTGDALVNTMSDVLSSDNPAKWVAAIALGTIGVGAMAIRTIGRMPGRS